MSDDPGSTPPAGGPPPPPPPGAVPTPPPGAVPPPLPTSAGGSAGPPPPPPGGTWPTATPEPTPPSRSKTGYIIGAVVAGLAIIGVGAFFLTRDDDDDPQLTEATVPGSVPEIVPPTAGEITVPDFTIPDLTIPDLTRPDVTASDVTSPTSGELPPPTEEPDGLGDDPELDALANDCYEGDMEACDDLYLQSESGSDYEHFGDTCAGRQPARTLILCTVTFPD